MRRLSILVAGVTLALAGGAVGRPNASTAVQGVPFTDAADVNGDGTLDLYLGNTQSRPPEIFLNDGQGHFRIAPGARSRRRSILLRT